jgi:hypothetical protein
MIAARPVAKVARAAIAGAVTVLAFCLAGCQYSDNPDRERSLLWDPAFTPVTPEEELLFEWKYGD